MWFIKNCRSLHSILLYYCICCLLGSWLRLFHSSLRLPYEWCRCCIKTKSYIVRWFFFNLPFRIDVIKICLLFVTIYTFFQRNTNKNCFFLGANADRHKYYQNNQKYWKNNCPYQLEIIVSLWCWYFSLCWCLYCSITSFFVFARLT